MQLFYPDCYQVVLSQAYPVVYVPYTEYPPKVNYPTYPEMPMAQIINTLPIYPPHLWIQQQETMATVQYYFSYGNLLQDPYLQSRMNSSLWVPLKDIHKFNKLVFLGVSFKQLQAFATQQMFFQGCSFELDKTRTLIRPSWAKLSMINFMLSFKTKINQEQLISKGRNIINKALKSVADLEQIRLETEDINLFVIGEEENGSVAAYFNAPGIPSLIKDLLKLYTAQGWKIQVKGINDSLMLS